MPKTAHEFRVFNLAWGLTLPGRRGRFPKGIIKVNAEDRALCSQFLKAKGVTECTEEWWERNRAAHGLERARQADEAKRVAARTAAKARVKRALPTLDEIKASGHVDPEGLLKEIKAERAAEESDLFGPGPGDLVELKASPDCVDAFSEDELREVLAGLGIQPPRRARLKVLREIAREGLRGSLKAKAKPEPSAQVRPRTPRPAEPKPKVETDAVVGNPSETLPEGETEYPVRSNATAETAAAQDTANAVSDTYVDVDAELFGDDDWDDQDDASDES